MHERTPQRRGSRWRSGVAPRFLPVDTPPMGTVYKLSRSPSGRGQGRNSTPSRNPRPPRQGRALLSFVIILAVVALGTFSKLGPAEGDGAPFDCSAPRVVDGDTLRCGDRRVRLAGIDAPELPGHCRPGRNCVSGDPEASSANLSRLVGSSAVRCRPVDTDRYGRTVARCSAGRRDLACAQIKDGFAMRRYGSIRC